MTRSGGPRGSGADGTDPLVGDRIVVRYRLGDATPDDWRGDPAAALSDVTGVLRDDGDPLVLERDGAAEAIPRSAVTSVRLLSRFTVRNSEIRSAEVAAAAAWPGVESAMVSGWLLRAGHGFTRRANSAVPIEFGAGTDATTLTAIREWYAARGLPAEAERSLAAARRLADVAGVSAGAVQVHLVDAFAALCRGDLARVVEVLEARIAADGGRLPRGDYPLGVAPDLVEAYLGLGRRAGLQPRVPHRPAEAGRRRRPLRRRAARQRPARARGRRPRDRRSGSS